MLPKTSFQCGKRPAGYYADIETGCQVSLLVHMDAVRVQNNKFYEKSIKYLVYLRSGLSHVRWTWTTI